MTKGILFDIKEFSVHDGPGIRITVFLKGCPLRCMWCHNPEGQSFDPQKMVSSTGLRQVGSEYTSKELADFINRRSDFLRANEGGVSFSGGEPLMQAGFISEVIDHLDNIHILLDTSGFGKTEDLELLLYKINMVYYDIKIVDPELHQLYTGIKNDLILQNINQLSQSKVPFVIRVPLIPNVTDTDRNLSQIAQLAQSLPGLIRVDLLPYNRAAGAKYKAAGMKFQPNYNEDQPVNSNVSIFKDLKIKVRIA